MISADPKILCFPICTGGNKIPLTPLADNSMLECYECYFSKTDDHVVVKSETMDDIYYLYDKATNFKSDINNASQHIRSAVHRNKNETLLSDDTQLLLVTKWFLKHQIPLAAYDDPYFKKLFPKLPCFDVFLSHLDCLCDEVKEHITNEFDGHKYSICADGWTDKRQRRYLGIDAHYINDDGTRTTRFLGLKTINEETHDAPAISGAIKETIEEYSLIKDDFYSLTTDSAAVMTKAASILDKEWVPCFAHLFNLSFELFVKHTPNEFRSIIQSATKLRKKAKFIERIEKLRVDDNSIHHCTVKQYSKTRWLSLVACVDSIVNLSAEICVFQENEMAACTQIEENSDEEEEQLMENLTTSIIHIASEGVNLLTSILPLLHEIKNAFEEILKKYLPTQPHMMFHGLDFIFSIINKYIEETPDSKFIDALRIFTTDLKRRFLDFRVPSIQKLAMMCMLDLKNVMPICLRGNEMLIKTLIVEEIEKDAPVFKTKRSVETPQPESSKPKSGSQKWFESVALPSSEPANTALEMIEKFLKNKPRIDENLLLVQWYDQNLFYKYKPLARLVYKLCLIIGTSVSLEHSFSIIKRILRPDRLSLSRTSANTLAVLTLNLDVLDKIYETPEKKEPEISKPPPMKMQYTRHADESKKEKVYGNDNLDQSREKMKYYNTYHREPNAAETNHRAEAERIKKKFYKEHPEMIHDNEE